jgi:uncharacterized membrane protein
MAVNAKMLSLLNLFFVEVWLKQILVLSLSSTDSFLKKGLGFFFVIFLEL